MLPRPSALFGLSTAVGVVGAVASTGAAGAAASVVTPPRGEGGGEGGAGLPLEMDLLMSELMSSLRAWSFLV